MRILHSLLVLLPLLPTLGAVVARAGDDILPPCYPYAVNGARVPSGPAKAGAATDSLAPGAGDLPRTAAPGGFSAGASLTTATAGIVCERVAPIGWNGAAMIVDPVRDRLVLYGGSNNCGPTRDAWTRSLADSGRWRRLEAVGPGPATKVDGAAVYDPVRDRMVVFGGFYTDGVWALSLSGMPTWTRLAAPGSGPGDRQGVRAIYDPVGDRMLAFGGYSPPFQNDVWAFALGDSSGWSKLSPSGPAPPTRSDGAVVYDSRRHRLLLYSGCDWNSNYPLPPTVPDLWALALDGVPAWTRLEAAGDVPPGLYYTATAYDSLRDRMVVYGGDEWAVGAHREAWVLDCGNAPSWTRLSPAVAPAARVEACLAHDDRRDRFVLFGGVGTDTWALTPGSEPAWTLLEPGGQEPAYMGYFASSAYDPPRHESLMLGGFGQYPAEGSWWGFALPYLWGLALDEQPRWTQLLPDTVAPSCVGQSMVVDIRSDRVVVYGGRSRMDGSIGGLTTLQLSDPRRWDTLDATGTPPVWRDLHTAIYDSLRARMVVFGGRGDRGPLGDTWTLSLDGAPRWERTDSVAAAPPGRFGHSAIYDPVEDRMIVFGGTLGTACYGDLWQLSLSGISTWTPMWAGAGPSPRAFASMVYDARRQRIVLIGGRGQDGAALDDVWFLPLASSATWVRANPASLPSGPRWGAAAAYDRDRDVVVLGYGTNDPCDFSKGSYNDTWLLHFSDPAPVPAIADLTSANPWAVDLAWTGLPVTGFTGAVQRRTEAGGWRDLGAVSPDVTGRVSISDRFAEPGVRYGYRLVWSAGAVASTSAELWVDVARLRLALACTGSNPSRDGMRVEFSLPDAAPAQIAVFDIAGRQLVRREVGSMGPGDHSLELASLRALRPGVYLVRLQHTGESIVVRASILR
jgi:hypothetical protein